MTAWAWAEQRQQARHTSVGVGKAQEASTLHKELEATKEHWA